MASNNPTTYEERSNNEFKQKPILIDKFQPTVITVHSAISKLKTTKEMMNAKLEKKRKKRAEKIQMLESMLAENTKKTNKLKRIQNVKIVNKYLCSILEKSLYYISNFYLSEKCPIFSYRMV